MNLDVTRALRLDRGPAEFPTVGTALPSGPSFGDTLKNTLGEVARLDKVADAHVQAMAQGQAVEPHQLMMAVEQANMALDLLIEVRNRLMESYQELQRTQI